MKMKKLLTLAGLLTAFLTKPCFASDFLQDDFYVGTGSTLITVVNPKVGSIDMGVVNILGGYNITKSTKVEFEYMIPAHNTLLVNFLHHIRDEGVTPYFGIGMGIAFANISNPLSALRYQAKFGIDYPLVSRMSVLASYNLFKPHNESVKGGLELGLKYSF